MRNKSMGCTIGDRNFYFLNGELIPQQETDMELTNDQIEQVRAIVKQWNLEDARISIFVPKVKTASSAYAVSGYTKGGIVNGEHIFAAASDFDATLVGFQSKITQAKTKQSLRIAKLKAELEKLEAIA